jgi:hypothetical protein
VIKGRTPEIQAQITPYQFPAAKPQKILPRKFVEGSTELQTIIDVVTVIWVDKTSKRHLHTQT